MNELDRGAGRGAIAPFAAACALSLVLSAAAKLDPVHAAEPALDVSASYTAVLQASSDDALDDSATASLDLLVIWPRGPGRLEFYVEGNTTLRENGVATRLPRSNADAGTALDTDRRGRVQLSELKYTITRRESRLISFGLLDPSAHLDVTVTHNDENRQFLGSSFVNNATIGFPDYTLGVAAGLAPKGGRTRWNLVLASSNGLADNPNLSYEQLLSVSERQKGLFLAAERVRSFESGVFRAGGWANTADHDRLDGDGSARDNHGVYVASGVRRDAWSAGLRLGYANPEVSLASAFGSIAVQHETPHRTVGIAAAFTRTSNEAPADTPASSSHLEAYARFRLGTQLELSPSVQFLKNAGFESSGTFQRDDVTVFSLRLHHTFFTRRPAAR